MSNADSSRRTFLKSSAYTAGILGAASQLASQAAATPGSANAKIRIGFVGPGGRGFGAHVKRLTKLQVEGQPIELVAVCDVYSEHRNRAAAHIKKETGHEPEKFEDYVEMYEKADLDAVLHWNARPLACQKQND